MNLFDDLRKRESAAPYERLARKALAAYGLEEARLDLLSHGDHVVFRASEPSSSGGLSSSDYVLHVYPRGWDQGQILRTLLWQTGLLRATDVLCPEPVLTRDGELVQSLSTPGVSGFRQVSVLGWVKGQSLEAAEWTADHARQTGRLIGTLHRQAETFSLPQDLAPKRRTAEALEESVDPVRLARAHAAEEETLFTDAVERVRQAMSALGTATDVAGLVHANLSLDHVLFDRSGARPIGFTHARWGYYAYDLAALDLRLSDLEDDSLLRGGLLDGYRETRPTEPDLAEHLGTFALLRLLDELRSLPEPSEPGSAAAIRGRAGRIVSAIRQAVNRL
ncbi:phosphotransferase enzyme family protein [Candidatus Bipolaricaulota bacterium]